MRAELQYNRAAPLRARPEACDTKMDGDAIGQQNRRILSVPVRQADCRCGVRILSCRRPFGRRSSGRRTTLRAKKYDEDGDLWQARVNYAWRFYFRIVGDVYLMDEIKGHPK